MKLRILSLNLWRYYGEWEKRKKKILEYIRIHNPDIVVFQECFDDGRHNKLGDNQAQQLNEELNFNTCLYSIAEMLHKEGGVKLITSVFDGLGIITNLPVKKECNFRLTQFEDDSHFRIVQRVELEKEGQVVVLYHTHFSNRDDWARKQLLETVTMAREESTRPIIVGDLNIKITSDIMEVAGNEYEISWFVKEYCSYPSKNENLDYVLIPKEVYSFEDITCDTDGLSDHRPLVVTISRKQ